MTSETRAVILETPDHSDTYSHTNSASRISVREAAGGQILPGHDGSMKAGSSSSMFRPNLGSDTSLSENRRVEHRIRLGPTNQDP